MTTDVAFKLHQEVEVLPRSFWEKIFSFGDRPHAGKRGTIYFVERVFVERGEYPKKLLYFLYLEKNLVGPYYADELKPVSA